MSSYVEILNRLMVNPAQVLAQSGFNIPQELNDPQAIIQHLLNSGQIRQEQVNRAMAIRNDPRFNMLFKH